MIYKIIVKNMVCPRCVSAVQNILVKLNISYNSVRLGEIETKEPINTKMKQLLKGELEAIGFTLINDRKSQFIEQMKSLVVEKVHHSETLEGVKWAEYITGKLNLDYKYLSSLFSSVESITFEQYVINQKIERVKELLIYDELSLSEIAFKLNYSSVAYLSNQFKKTIGMTPTQFKKSIDKKRKSLDKI